ncbi:MAG TPA: c-type cytochrome [Myxococcaceae bacterium]|nr:c-type cytochrome [Myxococcaceae bacterium]
MTPKTMLLAALSTSSLALAAPATTASSQVKRGEYLVSFGGCHDCHTPKKMGPKGPELDTERLLSGHPEQLAATQAPALPGPWVVATVGTLTAWSGPWGISYTANLTPDRETGLGAWTEQNFVDAMRTGRHLGRGRPILPPMPWEMVGKLTDQDLRAVFAYLKTIPAVKNRVPQPIPPAPPASASAAQPAPAH